MENCRIIRSQHGKSRGRVFQTKAPAWEKTLRGKELGVFKPTWAGEVRARKSDCRKAEPEAPPVVVLL